LARLAYHAPESVPTVRDGLHVFLEIADHLGSTAVVLDQGTSEVVEAGSYTAYGSADSDYRPARWGNFREDYRFTGKEEDSEVGLTYFGMRYLSPALGRWISADPLTVHGAGADLNAYAYVHAAILKAVDPVGLDTGAKGGTGDSRQQAKDDAVMSPPLTHLGEIEAYGRFHGEAWGRYLRETVLDAQQFSKLHMEGPQAVEKLKKLMLDRAAALPDIRVDFESDEEAEAYDRGISEGLTAGEEAAQKEHDFGHVWLPIAATVSEGKVPRVPRSIYGAFKGAIGDSKFILNALGKGRYGVAWVRWVKGTPDFANVAYKVNGATRFAVPGMNGGKGDQVLAQKVLAETWGKTEAEVKEFLSERELALHHVSETEMQLVPYAAHRLAHSGGSAALRKTILVGLGFAVNHILNGGK
jgi:RHS repeat-associated protein